MAATTISLQLRRNTLLKNPNSIKFFSSSSSSSSIPQPPPPQNDNDETTPSNQSQPSFSSYLKDLKQTSQQPFQQTQQPRSPFQQTFQRSQTQFQQTQPTKAASFEEIRKNLAEFRNRTAAPPPPGLNNSQSQFPSPSRGASNISFQELYKKNVESRGNATSENTGSTGIGGKMSYDMIRESLKQLRMNKPVEVNKGSNNNNVLGGSKLTDSLFGNTTTNVYGGGSLPAKVFGKEGSKKKEGESGEKKTKFLRMYTYGDLGEKLKMLRPEEAKENKGKWFSLKELSERLIKLRDNEEKESEADTKVYKGIRESLQKLASENDDKKKSSVHRIDILGQLGGTPNYMLSPPKEDLVEKYFHPDHMSSADKMKIELKRVRDEFKMSESDCGSSRVQVAQLTTKIKHLSSTLHKKDKHSRKGLQAMVQQRKKLLKYLRRTDWDSYCFVLDKLGLRDNPDYKN